MTQFDDQRVVGPAGDSRINVITIPMKRQRAELQINTDRRRIGAHRAGCGWCGWCRRP